MITLGKLSLVLHKKKNIYCEYSLEVFLWRNRKKYIRIIIRYSSSTTSNYDKCFVSGENTTNKNS